jgi:hypothetical protein
MLNWYVLICDHNYHNSPFFISFKSREYGILKEISSRALSGDHPSISCFASPTHTISRPEWNKLGRSERRRLFSTGSIHVVGPSFDKIMEEVKSWNDTKALNQYINLFAMRFVQGLNNSLSYHLKP